MGVCGSMLLIEQGCDDGVRRIQGLSDRWGIKAVGGDRAYNFAHIPWPLVHFMVFILVLPVYMHVNMQTFQIYFHFFFIKNILNEEVHVHPNSIL